MAEVCTRRGYAESSVAEIAKQAGVSTASFYRQFKDRRECMLASFEELFGRLLEEIEQACDAEEVPATRAKAGAAVAASLLAADPPTARLLSVEILAVGVDGLRLQHEAIERLAARLRGSAGAEPAVDASWAIVAAMVALVGKRTAEGRGATAGELEALAAPSDEPLRR
jgi:TetR/AcrR family transcriptional regulator